MKFKLPEFNHVMYLAGVVLLLKIITAIFSIDLNITPVMIILGLAALVIAINNFLNL